MKNIHTIHHKIQKWKEQVRVESQNELSCIPWLVYKLGKMVGELLLISSHSDANWRKNEGRETTINGEEL